MAPRAEVSATTAGARGAGAVVEAISSSPQGAQNLMFYEKIAARPAQCAGPGRQSQAPP